MNEEKMFINGKGCDAASGQRLNVINPANEEVIGSVPLGAEIDAVKAIETAHEAFNRVWRHKTISERASLLLALVDKLRENKKRLAKLLSTEHGKIYPEALNEVEDSAGYLLQSARGIAGIEGDILASTNPKEQVWIQKVPFGVTVGLLAWNFPLALAARKVAPALVAGNTMTVHAPSAAPLTVIEFAKLALEAGIPEGVFNVVTGEPEELCTALIQHPLTRLVSHTGSTAAGQKIMMSSAENLAEVILELGGNAPYIVMEDANVDAAVDAAVATRFYNGGQVCICGDRFYLHESVYDEFLSKFVEKIKKIKIGNQFSGADIGPKVLKSDVERIYAMISEAVANGANIHWGGQRPEGGEFAKGFWCSPTVITEVGNSERLIQEEIFGPVVPIVKIKSFHEALRLSNNSEYGLAAYVWTQDYKRIMQTIGELECGGIFVNCGIRGIYHGYHTGFKKSGINGEDGKYGLEHYLHKKTMYINFSGE